MKVKDMLLGGPGLDGYAYQADVYCIECGQDILRALGCGQEEVDDTEARDSNLFPQPIFFRESDTPQHCAHCETYLYG